MPLAERADRNSVSLGVLLAVAAHREVSFSVVQLAGRGITADAAASRWVLEVGKPSPGGFTRSDKMIEFGELEDELVGLWQEYGTGEVDVVAFEARVAEIVEAMEKRPSSPEGPVEDSPAVCVWPDLR